MKNDKFFSTGNHPIEALVPMLHLKNAGFDFLGMFDLKNTDSLPDHYKEAPVCLFEIDLES